MNSRFFASLAFRNLKANKQLFIPYAVAAMIMFTMFYLMASLMTNEFVQQRHSTLPSLFFYGVVVIAIFSLIFMLYTNSFLIKRRKQEMGLYGILGLEKKHVASILFFETFFSWVLTIVAGWLLGQLFGRLLFLFLNYLLGLPDDIPYSSSIQTLGMAVILFSAIYGLAYLYNLTQLTFAKPIQLLRGKMEGEKEPKGSLILFILGLAFLGWGYWISLSITNPLSAISHFFGAVLLVIIGTYLLYIAGSIFILKALKRRKSFYYQPGPFISVSGMLYRMKQNAVGLANICILSTMVIIAVATTLTLYIGTEGTLENRYPYEHNITVFGDMSEEDIDVSLTTAQRIVEEEIQAAGLEVDQLKSYYYQNFIGKQEGSSFEFVEKFELGDATTFLYVMTVEDYNALTGENYSLQENEALYYHSSDDYTEDELMIAGNTYQLKKVDALFESQIALTTSLALVVSSIEHMETFSQVYQSTYPDAYLAERDGSLGIDTNGTGEQKRELALAIRTSVQEVKSARYESRELQRDEWYSMNGGFLFLGIFLGLLFTVGTVLITYFKQISEGFDDRGKFQIMHKVGLDQQMIRDSTKSQLIWMFVLPITTAIIHVAFAYPIVGKLLMMFGILDNQSWLIAFTIVVVSFALIYGAIYKLTSRVYYQIVK